MVPVPGALPPLQFSFRGACGNERYILPHLSVIVPNHQSPEGKFKTLWSDFSVALRGLIMLGICHIGYHQ